MLVTRPFLVGIALLLAVTVDSTAESGRAAPRNQPPIQTPSSQPAQPPTPDQRGTDQSPLTIKVLPSPKSADETEKEERERRYNEEKAAVDKRLADDTQRIASETKNLADYTGWLVLVTIFMFCAAVTQIGFFYVQLKDMRENIRLARVSAVTAQQQVELTKIGIIDLERAYLAVGPTQIKIDFINGDAQKARGHFIETDPQELTVKLVVHNTGRTGATLKKIFGEFSNVLPISEIPIYDEEFVKPIGTDLVITAGGGSILEPYIFQSDFIGPQYFWGYIEYRDIFKNTRTARFCARLEPAKRGEIGKYQIAGSESWRECD